MAALTPDQRRKRERVETLISIAAPALNLLLAFGDRLSILSSGSIPPKALRPH